tara:strand:+ start:736 stop:990 length:255 start_codon:yes stop_codon:yes gene_type:complete
MHNDRTYAIINITDLASIDFSEIGETSELTIREKLDDIQFVIKWEMGEQPSFITDGSVVPIETYDHHDALELMHSIAWQEPIPM